MSAVNQGNLWNVWGQALGGWLDRRTQQEISGFALTTEAAAFGMDRKFGSLIQAGLVLGYSNSGQIGGKHIAVDGGSQYSGFSLDGRARYTSLDNSAGRTITTPVFTGKVASSFDSSVGGKSTRRVCLFLWQPRIGPAVFIDYSISARMDAATTVRRILTCRCIAALPSR